jgi:hypothetical protein
MKPKCIITCLAAFSPPLWVSSFVLDLIPDLLNEAESGPCFEGMVEAVEVGDGGRPEYKKLCCLLFLIYSIHMS